jgi:hypothetical protein
MSGILSTGKRSRMVAAGVLTVGLLGGAGFVQAANGQSGGPNGVQAADPHRALETTAKATCNKYWITVNADGTPARGSCGAKTAVRIAAGQYQVNWTRSERLCGRFATVGLAGASGTELPGFITTVGRAGKPKATFVGTYDTAGSFADRSFHLHLSC